MTRRIMRGPRGFSNPATITFLAVASTSYSKQCTRRALRNILMLTMLKPPQSQSGFAHIGMLALVLLVAGAVGLAVWQASTQLNSGSGPKSSESPRPRTSGAPVVLKNLGLTSLSNVLVTSDALRDYDSRGLKGFYIFGDNLGTGDPRRNPNFEYASLKPGTKAVAAIDGVVAFVRQQPSSNDYEVFLQPEANSHWTVAYDHLVDLSVRQGQTVKAGDVLGAPAVQGNGALRFELQINNESVADAHRCPTTLLAANVRDAVLADLTALMQEWNNLAGRQLYDLSRQDPAGCLGVTSLSPAQAEGQ